MSRRGATVANVNVSGTFRTLLRQQHLHEPQAQQWRQRQQRWQRLQQVRQRQRLSHSQQLKQPLVMPQHVPVVAGKGPLCLSTFLMHQPESAVVQQSEGTGTSTVVQAVQGDEPACSLSVVQADQGDGPAESGSLCSIVVSSE